MFAALERELHVLGGLDLLDRARDVETTGVMAGVCLVCLCLNLTVDDKLVVVEVAGVSVNTEVVAHVLCAQALLARHERLVQLLAVARADDADARATEYLLHRLG